MAGRLSRKPAATLAISRSRKRKRKDTSSTSLLRRADHEQEQDTTESEDENPTHTLRTRTRKTSSTAAAGPSRATRRSSLPRRTSPPFSRPLAGPSRLHPPTARTTLRTKGFLHSVPHRRPRLQILSPLPVNHSVRHPSSSHHAIHQSGSMRQSRSARTKKYTRSTSTMILADETGGNTRKRKRVVDRVSSEAEEEEVSEEEVEEDEDDDVEEEADVEMTDDTDDYHLHLAPATALNRLLRPEVQRLHALATSVSLYSSSHLTKPQLIQEILEARPEPSEAASDEQDASSSEVDDADSPHASTSKEPSPFPSKRTRSRPSQHPTPPPSSSSSSTFSAAPRPTRTLRRGSQSLPNVAPRVVRTRSGSMLEGHELRNGKKILPGRTEERRSVKARGRKGKNVQFIPLEEEADDGADEHSDDEGPSPVAHRTRGGTAGSPGRERPERAAKVRAVARIAGRRTRGQVETPPEEGEMSEEEGEEEVDVSVEIVSHERAARKLRNGKVVELRKGSGEEEDEEEEEEDEEMETASELEGSEEEVGEEKEEEEAVESEGGEEGDEVDLASATSKSLLRFSRDDLVRLCEERELDGEGTKKELVHALLEWRDQDFDASSGAGSSSQSTASAASNATARARKETKTQALAAIVSSASSVATPLLMREDHSSSPEKPHTPEYSKHDEQEEVNALDLESLQLQDKEIAPEKLTRLEKVGSGGFKDVYKGIYRKKTIAIADIRGHLTEMDIKELGLLRDLRHPNIVHFIGVSIPKEPSSVPVMIVTELCANGDLFDYIRGVAHPPWLSMVEMMLGIARGMDYLHSRKPSIIHRDIKSSNVLITAQGVAKINDFGLARVKTSTRSMIRSLVGTVNYQAPELWTANPRYSEKVDVYSTGLVYWEMLTWNQPVKRYPFEGMNEHAIYSEVGQKHFRPSTAGMGRLWGLDILHLISAMWDNDPSQRPSMAQVVLELEVIHTTEKDRIAKEKRERR